MAEPRPDFWESGLPFISDADGKTVDWIDVGLWAIGAVLTAIYTKIAQLIETLWNVLIIDRAQDISAAYTSHIENVFAQGESVVSFESATSLASDSGLIGALIITAAGAYLIAWFVGVIRDE